jgi:hypothetical protein
MARARQLTAREQARLRELNSPAQKAAFKRELMTKDEAVKPVTKKPVAMPRVRTGKGKPKGPFVNMTPEEFARMPLKEKARRARAYQKSLRTKA